MNGSEKNVQTHQHRVGQSSEHNFMLLMKNIKGYIIFHWIMLEKYCALYKPKEPSLIADFTIYKGL